MTLKEYYNINESVEFLDILMDNDLEVFIDPFLIANNLENMIAKRIYVRSKEFLKVLNQKYILPLNRDGGLKFLSHLQEANEYHLGYSFSNKGKGIGLTKAEIIYDSLCANRFARNGLTITNEAHNVLLLVPGIGQDNMSDTLANICRDILSEFTKNQCNRYHIPLFQSEIEYFEHISKRWKTKMVMLPKYKGKRFILVPQFLTSGLRIYPNHYNWFMASNYLSKDILSGKLKIDESGHFVTILKDGTKRAIVKNINSFFRKPKNELIDFVLDYNDSLIEFQSYAKENYPSIDFDSLILLYNKAS